jgi:hypothetical protein
LALRAALAMRLQILQGHDEQQQYGKQGVVHSGG